MSAFNLRRFANPNILKKIEDVRLLKFLEPHRDYLVGRGFRWPDAANPAIDYQALASIVTCPDDRTPPQMIRALQIVDDLATPLGALSLLDGAEQLGLGLGLAPGAGKGPRTPADIALEAWLKAENRLIAFHEARRLGKKRSFEFLASQAGPTPIPSDVPARRPAIERMLSAWYDSMDRGPAVRVTFQTTERETQFVIWHGDAFRRDTAIADDGQAVPVGYRPGDHGVVAYNAATGELRVNAAALKSEKDLFRRAFGLHLFGSEEHFHTSTPKYLLDTLQLDGAQALICTDVPGLKSMRLVAVRYRVVGAQEEIITHEADHDLFAAIAARGESLRNDAIFEARFKALLCRSRTEVGVVLGLPNVLRCGKEEDIPIIEDWSAKRGFTVNVRSHSSGSRLAAAS